MKRSRLFAFLLALSMLWVLVVPTLAQGGVVVVANNNLNLRASPDRHSARLGTVPYQTELEATAISPDRLWVAVVYNGQGGWLSLLYTGVLQGSLGALPVSSQTFTLGGGGVTSNVLVAPVVNLRYRTEPTLALRPAGAIPWNTEVPALGLSEDGLFVLVNYLGQNVWVYRQYVREVAGSLDSFVPGALPESGSADSSSSETQSGDSGSSSGGFPAFCSLPCSRLTCEQAYQCGGHPVRDRDQDGRACESQCW